MKSDFIKFGTVHLDITDLARSVAFWHGLVGLHHIEATDTAASLGVDGAPLVVLHRSATRPVQRGFRGLFHLAIHLPSEAELSCVLARLQAARHRFGASDHIVAKSLYLNDPDGIGLEIAFETPERVRSYRWDQGTDSPLVIDSEGRKRHGIEPLDLDDVLAKLPDNDIKRPLPSGTIVGHLQFQVGNLDASYRFYRDKVGLIQNMYAPWNGYGDLGAGGRVAHRIALNTWQGAGAPPRPSEMAGLRSFTVNFLSPERLNEAVARIPKIETRNRQFLAHDPDANVILMTT